MESCPHCGETVRGYRCDSCGGRVQSTAETAINLGFLGIIAIAFIAWYISSLQSEPERKRKPGPGHSAVGAWVACENFVENRLRAPATADFPCCYSDFVTHEGGGVYPAKAYVDAENAFGAQIRNDFTCTVEYRSGDRWRLQDLEITGR